MAPHKVGILTAGGLAPCLSSSIGALIERYTEVDPSIELVCYRAGYKGLLTGDSIEVTPAIRAVAHRLHAHGGSPIGNSRVKLTNVKDCVERGFVESGQDPMEVAGAQLMADGVTILHTIGGDDTNTMAGALAAHLRETGRTLTVVGMPKTIDNDVFPIEQTLGADTAARQGALYFSNIVHEFSANPRMLIVHEVMGRACGWLTAATARQARADLEEQGFVPELGIGVRQKDVHAVYIPEMKIDLEVEARRLAGVMDELDCVNIFLSEGAGVESIVAEMEASGQEVPRDAFGHVKLDKINPGQWFGEQFARRIGAQKVLVQKSGYFARSAAASDFDRALIKESAAVAVESALVGVEGVVGKDEDRGGELRTIEFDRIAGHKPFNVHTPWFEVLLEEIGQR